jgi:phage gp36-like protein
VRVTERDEVRYRTAAKTLATIAEGKLSLGVANVATPMATAPTADLAMMAKSNSSPFSNGGW